MAKYRGRVDCYLEPGSNRQANGEFFVNLIQHISSSMSDLGIDTMLSHVSGSTQHHKVLSTV